MKKENKNDGAASQNINKADLLTLNDISYLNQVIYD